MANAGAEPPLICRDGEIIKPKVEGVPAGLLDDREYEEVIFDAEPGDVIVLYSDGITDQPNPKGDEYGTQPSGAQAAEAVRQDRRKRSPIEILADLDEFTRRMRPRIDDQTLDRMLKSPT